MSCEIQNITLLGLLLTVTCSTVITILITLRDQIGYKHRLDKYIERYGDIIEYLPK
jgi:hypothetical protein